MFKKFMDAAENSFGGWVQSAEGKFFSIQNGRVIWNMDSVLNGGGAVWCNVMESRLGQFTGSAPAGNGIIDRVGAGPGDWRQQSSTDAYRLSPDGPIKEAVRLYDPTTGNSQYVGERVVE